MELCSAVGHVAFSRLAADHSYNEGVYENISERIPWASLVTWLRRAVTLNNLAAVYRKIARDAEGEPVEARAARIRDMKR
jgi:hypothetical protein